MDFKLQNAYFITAGIACGKSSFLKIAKDMSFDTLSADEYSHKIMDLYSSQIAALFTENILTNNKIDRKKLGKIVFLDKKKLKILEAFIHPLIRQAILKDAASLDLKKKPFFIELPLFFESKAYFKLGKSILIYANKKNQLKRLIQRDALDEKDAIRRIDSLINIEEKLKMSDIIIKNDADFKSFELKVKSFLNQLLEKR